MDMAPNTLPSRPTPESFATSHQPNLRNPLPLSAAQEAQVKDIYYKRVRARCAQEIKGSFWLYCLQKAHNGYQTS